MSLRRVLDVTADASSDSLQVTAFRQDCLALRNWVISRFLRAGGE